MSEHKNFCLNCGTDPLENSHNVDVELSDGVTIKAYLCGGCGIIYVPEPHETVSVARVKQTEEISDSVVQFSENSAHSTSGTVKDKPTARLVCKVEGDSYRVFDPSNFEFCPICGRKLRTEDDE